MDVPQKRNEGIKSGMTAQNAGTRIQKIGTRAHSPKPPFLQPFDFCLLLCDMRQDRNRNCSEKLVQMSFPFWVDSLGWFSSSQILSRRLQCETWRRYPRRAGGALRLALRHGPKLQKICYGLTFPPSFPRHSLNTKAWSLRIAEDTFIPHTLSQSYLQQILRRLCFNVTP